MTPSTQTTPDPRITAPLLPGPPSTVETLRSMAIRAFEKSGIQSMYAFAQQTHTPRTTVLRFLGHQQRVGVPTLDTYLRLIHGLGLDLEVVRRSTAENRKLPTVDEMDPAPNNTQGHRRRT